MKKLFLLSGVFIFILAAIAPLDAHAQTFRGDRGRSSSIRRKIDNLDEDKVKNVPLPILFGLTPLNLSPNFADPRDGGARMHEGLDIIAPRRALIISPTDAVVTSVGNGDSSGNYVYTANPGGETFAYMHLDEMSDLDEGDVLKAGDFIGYVGNTGNAAGGVTHLHFEIRDGDPEDPFPRIQSIFPLADKIEFLKEIINNAGSASNKKKLAESVVALYRKDLIAARPYNPDFPAEIEDALVSVPVTVTVSLSGSGSSNGNLALGSKGAAVATLQKFLIKKDVDSADKIVADGSFGPITKKALMEYQASVGLTADGSYGPKTRAYVESHP